MYQGYPGGDAKEKCAMAEIRRKSATNGPSLTFAMVLVVSSSDCVAELNSKYEAFTGSVKSLLSNSISANWMKWKTPITALNVLNFRYLRSSSISIFMPSKNNTACLRDKGFACN